MDWTRPRLLVASLVATAVLPACASGGSVSGSIATTMPTSTSTAAPNLSLSGIWEGDLVDATGSYPARLTIDSCDTVGEVCAALEYGMPEDPATVLCASDLALDAVERDRLTFTEVIVYHPWSCLPTVVVVRPVAGGVEVEQVTDGVVCCRGDFTPAADRALPPPSPLPGIGTATPVLMLPGATTQYVASTPGAAWLPLEDTGQVVGIDAATGSLLASLELGDPHAEPEYHSDPHGIAADGHGVWVGQVVSRTLARIDPDTGAIVDSLTVPVAPYALASDGETLWVTSFLDDALVGIDIASREVRLTVSLPKPTGIAITDDAVWVVLHRDDAVVSLDRATGTMRATIDLGGAGGIHPVCGSCIENIVYAIDALWTADNWSRSVSRIDPATGEVTAIALPGRVWSVAAGGGWVWASLLPEEDGTGGGVARIDPATGDTVIGELDVLGIFWAGDTLWAFAPAARGDLLYRIDPTASP